jgi:arylsulfatase
MLNFKPLISWSLLALLLTPADLAAAECNAGTEPVAIPHQSTQILDEFIRDPHVLLAPDGMYYLTGTTAGTNFGEIVGVRVWRSPDLANWEDLGFVWTLDQSSWLADVPGLEGKKNPRAIWAPELHWFDGTFWIVHTTNLRRAGLMRSTTGRIEGPYEDGGGWMGHRHDPTFFTDTDGSRYLVYAATQYQAIDLDEPAFLSEPVRIEAENRLQGHEGSVIHRVGDHYVLFWTGWSDRSDESTMNYNLYYAVSERLDSGYGEQRLAVRYGGHGTPFQDKHGRWWTTAFHNPRGQTIVPPGATLIPLEMVDHGDDVTVRTSDPSFADPAAPSPNF